jgi:hypothetical protein
MAKAQRPPRAKAHEFNINDKEKGKDEWLTPKWILDASSSITSMGKKPKVAEAHRACSSHTAAETFCNSKNRDCAAHFSRRPSGSNQPKTHNSLCCDTL